jgi:hypothetical protein
MVSGKDESIAGNMLSFIDEISRSESFRHDNLAVPIDVAASPFD